MTQSATRPCDSAADCTCGSGGAKVRAGTRDAASTDVAACPEIFVSAEIWSII